MNDGSSPGTETVDGTVTSTPTVDKAIKNTDTSTVTADPDVPPPRCLTADPDDATIANTISFENLDDGQRAAFLDSVSGVVRFAPESPYVDVEYAMENGDVFSEYEYLRYDGGLYKMEFYATDPVHPSYTYTLRPDEPTANDSVVRFENLSQNSKGIVEQALELEDYETPPGGPKPSVFLEWDVIVYENETYRPDLRMFEDHPTWILNSVKCTDE